MTSPTLHADMSDDLQKLAIKLGTDGPIKTLPANRKIQLLFNGHYIIRTTKAILVWEHQYYPQLYIPLSELTSSAAADPALQVSQTESFTSPTTGNLLATQLTLQIASKSIDGVLSFAADLPGNAAQLSHLVKIPFDAIDKWFEEDTEIHIHPKDPFKRVDVIHSSRRIRVRIGGEIVADTRSSAWLFETGLPCRYYMPLTAIDPQVLRRSDTKTGCPYKGEAEYYHVEVGGKTYEDVVWYYPRPLLECAKIEGLCCFYNEKVQIELDGEVLESPVTTFSNRKPNDKPSIT